jgi:hypothetical protein
MANAPGTRCGLRTWRLAAFVFVCWRRCVRSSGQPTGQRVRCHRLRFFEEVDSPKAKATAEPLPAASKQQAANRGGGAEKENGPSWCEWAVHSACACFFRIWPCTWSTELRAAPVRFVPLAGLAVAERQLQLLPAVLHQ